MASIFSLFGEIFIDNEKANKGLEETAKKGEDTGDKIKAGFGKVIDVAAKVGTAVVGAASAVGAAAYKMATDTADYAGAVDDLSERTGIGREEIQRWKFALEQSGGSVNALQAATKKMSSVITEAANGSKGAEAALNGLGLSAKELEGLTVEQQFNKIVGALAEMEPGAERNALGAKLMGKAYMELAPTLNQGKDGIQALKDEADRLGMVMSEDAVKAADDFGDTVDKIKGATQGLMNQLGSVAITAIQPLLDMVIDNMPLIQSLVLALVPILGDLFQQVLPPLMDLAQELFPIILDLIKALLPVIGDLLKNLLPPILNLIEMLLPPIVEIVQKLLPPLMQLLGPIFQLLDPIFKLLQPFIDLLMLVLDPLVDLINAILPPMINWITKAIEIAIIPLQAAFEYLAGIIGGSVKGAFEWVTNIFETMKDVFRSFIDFFKNVFAGNWEGAWENIKDIFSRIWEGIKAAFKIPINWVIDGINAFIRGINKLEIPDWVPGVGGKGFHIKEIARLRIGMEYVPYDDFPALLHKGERVMTARQAEEYDSMASGMSAGGNREFNFGGLHIENFNNNSNMDIYELFELFWSWIQDRILSQGAVWNNA